MQRLLLLSVVLSIWIAAYGFYVQIESLGTSGLSQFADLAALRFEVALSALPVLFLGLVVGTIEGISSRLRGGLGMGIWSLRLGWFAPGMILIGFTSWLTLPYSLPLLGLWMLALVVGLVIPILIIRGIPAW